MPFPVLTPLGCKRFSDAVTVSSGGEPGDRWGPAWGALRVRHESPRVSRTESAIFCPVPERPSAGRTPGWHPRPPGRRKARQRALRRLASSPIAAAAWRGTTAFPRHLSLSLVNSSPAGVPSGLPRTPDSSVGAGPPASIHSLQPSLSEGPGGQSASAPRPSREGRSIRHLGSRRPRPSSPSLSESATSLPRSSGLARRPCRHGDPSRARDAPPALPLSESATKSPKKRALRCGAPTADAGRHSHSLRHPPGSMSSSPPRMLGSP